MNCEESLPLLEEYFDGELAPADAARVAAHLRVCAACAREYETLGREQEFFHRAEPTAVGTAADLWAGVSARLRSERGGRAARLWRGLRERAVAALGAPRISPALTAAAVLAAIVLTAGVMKYLDARRPTHPAPAEVARQGGPPALSPAVAANTSPSAAPGETPTPTDTGGGASRAPARPAEGGAGAKTPAAGVGEPRRVDAPALAESGRRARPTADGLRREPTADQLVREAERKYVAAIALLARDVRRRRTPLDAGEAARFERTLAAVDRAIAETRRAARRRPADPVAAQYMLAAYSKKIDLLREMASN